jgi:hypothetical protein
VDLAIALGCFALAVVFAMQAVASLRKGVSVMGLLTAITAASTAFIGVWVLWGR